MDDRTERAGHDEIREWVSLEREPEALLSRDQRRRVDQHLAACSDCSGERERLIRLETLLAGGVLPVRAGFRADVMRSLPAAGWEARSPRAWRLPVAVLVLLALAAAFAVAMPAARTGDAGPVSGTAGAVADMIATGALAAAGMLWASWRGMGVALDAFLSPGAAFALLILVVSLDVLLLSLLVRRGRKPAPEIAGRRRGP
jgi:hypothetical protein